jgi:hypothetical protein
LKVEVVLIATQMIVTLFGRKTKEDKLQKEEIKREKQRRKRKEEAER